MLNRCEDEQANYLPLWTLCSSPVLDLIYVNTKGNTFQGQEQQFVRNQIAGISK